MITSGAPSLRKEKCLETIALPLKLEETCKFLSILSMERPRLGQEQHRVQHEANQELKFRFFVFNFTLLLLEGPAF